MKRKNIIIVVLLVVAVAAICIVKFAIINPTTEKNINYAIAQNSAMTHDIQSVEKYKDSFLGNAVTISNIYDNLPLYNYKRTYEIQSKDAGLIVNYLATPKEIGEDNIKTALVYNSAVAFSLINNLNHIQYNFTGGSYTLDRATFEENFSTNDLAELITERWKETVQSKMGDPDFIEKFY